MKFSAIYIIGVVDIIILASCEDIYHPVTINSDSKIPVIQARVMENEVPVVKLYWALGYQKSVVENISGARVYVSNNTGDTVKLEETSPGNYTTFTGNFKGEPGKIYTLKVTMADENIYVSSPVLMPYRPIIDSLYVWPGTKTVFIYDENKNPFSQEQQGLYVLADLSGNKDSTLYYRFNTKITQQMMHTINLYTLDEYSIFTWDSYFLDEYYSVNFTLTQNDHQILRQHHLGFLQYYFDDSNANKTTTGTFIVGWVVCFNVFSISSDVYNYYNSVSEQLNADHRIFSPEPSQLKSNIHCLNNPAKSVVGVFDASSLTRVYKAFGWKSIKDFYSKNLSSFPDTIYSGTSAKFPPDWWVLF